MKKIKIFLAAFAAMATGGLYAQTDAEYAAANAEIQANGVYKIYTYSNGTTTGDTKYYLKSDGYLTDDAASAGQFTFDFQRIFGGYRMGGYRINKFTNGGASDNSFSGDALKKIITSGQNRTDWEAQVFFKSESGYAVRSTNANSSNWGAPAFWTVVADNDDDGLPNATYTVNDVPYVWQLEMVSAGDWSDVTAKYIQNYEPNTAEKEAGWTVTPGTSLGDYDGHKFSNNVAEFYRRSGGGISQTANNLPMGYYTFTALASARANTGGTISANGISKGIVALDINNTTDANTQFTSGNGVNTIDFCLDATSNVTFALTAGTTGDAWTVYRCFYLTYNSEPVVLRKALAQAKETANNALNNSDYSSVTGFERAQLTASVAKTINETQSPSVVQAAYNSLIEEIGENLADFQAAPKYYTQLGEENTRAALFGIAAQTTDSQSAFTAVDIQAKAIYNYVVENYTTAIELGAWTITNAGNMTGQHWDGTGSTSYNEQKDGWATNTAWETSYIQDVTLPEGDYVFKVAGRHSQYSTLTLSVTNGETVLGSISDFPVGDTGRGINTSGTADFATGEGHTYANGGNGRGWQWRYVPFTLSEETTVTISVMGANPDAQYYQWVSFCNYTVQAIPGVAASRAAYTQAVTNANDALNDATYANVGGTDRSNLVAAVAETPTETVEWYDAQTTLIQNYTTAFTAGVSSWNAYASAIAGAASEKAKADALNTSIYTTALGSAPNTAEEAAAKAASLLNEIRVGEYNYIVDNYTTAIKLGEWTQEGGTTFNYGGQHWSGDNSQGYWEQTTANYSSSSWAISFNQTIELPAGTYVFKVAGRHSGSSEMALEVTNADTEAAIGSVNDFPASGTGKGIATDGTANFTDGTFANGGNGYGFQWRFVPFTLAETTNVNVAVTASAAAQYQWISFCNYTVQAIPSAAVSILAYNQALAEAEAARDDAAYANITGSEKTALLAAIAGDATLDKSDMDKIDEAKDDLVSATTTFINAKAAYDTFADAKTVVYEELPYASSTKYAAIATAQEATATSAADATDKTSVIISAYRKYVESNALAEGVAGAENKTSLISDPNMEVTYDGTAHTFGAWQVIGQTNGTIQLLSSESFTDGDGNSNYKYVDIFKNDNNAGIQQTLSSLAPGRYILTVTARAQATAGASFKVFAGSTSKEIERIGNSGGVFGRGWNDATLVFDVLTEGDVNIGVQSGNGKDLWWSATRFRLARLGNVQVSIDENTDYAATEATSVDVELARTIKADAWNTFVVPFDITNAELKAAFGNDVEVAEFSDGGASEDAVTVSFTKMGTPAITANTPVLLKSSTAGTSYSFTNRSVVTGTTTIAGTYVDFVGTYDASTTITEGNYFISGNKLWKSSGATTINGTRAYIDAKNVASVRLFIDDVETGIEAINGVEAEDGAIYNIAGQRLGKMQKGINIVNGKKIIK